MSRELHTLTLTVTEPPRWYDAGRWGWQVDMGEWGASITCYPGGCNGWQECREEHSVDGYTGENDGPDDSDEDAPWADEEEFEFHGVLHEWRSGWGWTVPFNGCVVSVADSLSDFADNILREYGPGEYLVDDDWGDDSLDDLMAVSMVDGSPLPEKGWLQRVIGEHP